MTLPCSCTKSNQQPQLQRRRCLGWGAAGLLLCLSPYSAYAQFGKGQAEEPLGNSVRTAMSAAIGNSAPPTPVLPTPEARAEFDRWYQVMDQRLRGRISDDFEREEFLNTVWYETKRSGLETALIMGLIQVESTFRKYAISSVGARGFMQIMPFWMRLIGNGDVGRLFHMQTNLRFGCVILRHYIDRENGNLFYALGRYNGSRGRATYPDAVFAARGNWLM